MTPEELLPQVHQERRKPAAAKLAMEQLGKRLDAAVLVQETFFKLTECAEVLSVSPRTADTWWAYARAWLAVELKD